MNKQNISDIHNCYGCGVCSKPCPVHIIDIHLNAEGFYEPYLTDADKCIHCGLCRDVCAYIKEDLAASNQCKASYAAWSNDEKTRHDATSGGAGFEITRYLMEQGYTTIGARYNPETQRAEHFEATSLDDLCATTGSKYIQSYTVDGWKAVDRKKKFLIIGTPCQIDSFRNYMKLMRLPVENFVLLDFYCHGVPSMLAWKKYVREAEQKLGGRLTDASWRNKANVGWHNSYNMHLTGGGKSLYSSLSQGDEFLRAFLCDQCLGRHCYLHCKYKYDKSSADIRIGDLWGETYKDNEKGVSCAIAFTERGLDVLKHINCTLVDYPLSTVAEGQMKTCPPMLPLREQVIASLHNPILPLATALQLVDNYHCHQRNIQRLKHPLRTSYHILCRLLGRKRW